MSDKVKCAMCAGENAGIPSQLKCSECGTDYFYSKETGRYYLKAIKCKICGKSSSTITSQLKCSSCNAKYSYAPIGLFESAPYGEERKDSFFIRGDNGPIMWVEGILFLAFLAQAFFAVMDYKHFYSNPSFYLPLFVIFVIAGDCFRRLANARKHFGKVACLTEVRAAASPKVVGKVGRTAAMKMKIEGKEAAGPKAGAEKTVVKKRRIWIWLGGIANFLFGSEDEKIEPCGTYSAIDGLFMLAVFVIGLYYFAMFFLFLVPAIISFSVDVSNGDEQVYWCVATGIICTILVVPYILAEERIERGY